MYCILHSFNERNVKGASVHCQHASNRWNSYVQYALHQKQVEDEKLCMLPIAFQPTGRKMVSSLVQYHDPIVLFHVVYWGRASATSIRVFANQVQRCIQCTAPSSTQILEQMRPNPWRKTTNMCGGERSCHAMLAARPRMIRRVSQLRDFAA
jgi:hypothetical protein